MRWMMCLAAMVAVAAWAVEPRVAAQKQGQLFMSVIGPDGMPISDLKPTDVGVNEDGVECKVVKLEPVDWPIKLQILVDNGKLTTTPINSMRDGLKALFDTLPDGIEMSMYVTAGSPRPIVRPTTDKKKLIDSIPLIAPDSGAGMFFDALTEAAARIEKDKTQHFPVIFMVGSDFGRINALDRDYQKLQETIVKRAVTVHIIVMASSVGTTSTGGALQTELGLALTKLSGGHYDNINSVTRLTTLLPEYGKRIADSNVRQTHQYRITYERPANAKEQPRIGALLKRDGTPALSIDGHHP
jgi:hypothetical protein